MLQAFAREGKILLATTLIEVGISLPRLSTIVIVAPERLGLATLHQLRGRVSRNGLK
ncbi:ATP-dependent DNA helicase RecG [compost metagenome]